MTTERHLTSPLADRRALPPMTALRAFEVVGRVGGIRRAAAVLALDHAAVSRHVRSLELWAGMPLIERSGGGGRLTPDGEKFHRRISAALLEIASAAADLTRRLDDGRLNIFCVPGIASHWLMARLADFRTQNPEIDIELHPSDNTPDFGRHEADVDIRYSIDAAPLALGPEVQSMEIARPPVLAVAAPSMFAAGPPRTPAALLKVPLLHEGNFRQWTEWFEGNGIDTSAGDIAGPRMWHANLTVDAARRGEGVALTNVFLLGDDLEAGRLLNVSSMVGARATTMGAYVFVSRRDRWTARPIALFRNWLVREAKARVASTKLALAG
ncbi:LysR substrate-binding domain-containing protein [Phenylobacterium sp.]|uniref:LysR substrate-binding domain-containing protein n=1 Tax=Phenylobacterium sp. TaxID=1871053 RepID=UPI00301B91A0